MTGETEDERSRRPVVVGLLTLLGLVAVAGFLYRSGTIDRLVTTSGLGEPFASESTDTDADEATDATQTGADSGADDEGRTGGAVTGEADSGGSAASDSTDPSADEEAGVDSLMVRIEPSAPETDSSIAPATATIRSDGKLYIEGAFRSESEAERFVESASDVFGEAALVSDYTIDPAAPNPTVSDVVLEKPVLFETGSAVIDPEYIPFLEACGDVLKLNSHIVMSVSAFTDSSGDADFNLELSQARADAVVDFYRNLDIGDDQLISVGLGESDFVADNDTEEGRRENRRAMLELLNVISDT